MIRKPLMALLLLIGTALSALQAENTPAIPDMNRAMAQAQKGMTLLPFLTAPIENSEKLTSKDVEHFIEIIEKKDTGYAKYADGMEMGYEKAAQVLKPGVSFDTFIAKAIELSGMKAELDSEAQRLGYKDALDLTIKSSRIMRAMMQAEMEKEIAKAPKEQQEMMRSMSSGMLGKGNPDDMAVVAPFSERLKAVAKQP